MDLRTDIQSVPGLEATHVWENVITLVDNDGSLPRYYGDGIDGLHDLPDMDDEREPSAGLPRELVYPSLSRGKTVSYNGVVQAEKLEAMRFRSAALRAAFLTDMATLREGTMKITPRAGYGGHRYRYKARVRAFTMDDKQTYEAWAMPSAYQRIFLVTLRMSDGRFFVDDAPVSIQSGAAPGGATVFVDASNPGTAPADPVIRITGPVVDPVISRPGAMLRFAGVDLTGAQYLDVNFGTRSALTSNGNEVADHVTVDSTWWDTPIGLPPATPLGVPTVTRVTLSQMVGFPGVGARVRVNFDPAVW